MSLIEHRNQSSNLLNVRPSRLDRLRNSALRTHSFIDTKSRLSFPTILERRGKMDIEGYESEEILKRMK
ncbi:hypothetical protein EYC80_007097 [Monilinia laxa]|uniref:Uncharacterized protein n=1 Tax=Monilinia laxa TaxID=61186 RepID=A0A5N6K075_MONLA|nr:hypothetical protein EYC80_007097 [Monilinia laxa]